MAIGVHVKHSLLLPLPDIYFVRQLLWADGMPTQGTGFWLSLMLPGEHRVRRGR